MQGLDYAGRVESYLCEHRGDLGEPLTSELRKNLEAERPLTLGDAERWIESIDYHIGWNAAKSN